MVAYVLVKFSIAACTYMYGTAQMQRPTRQPRVPSLAWPDPIFRAGALSLSV